VADVYPPRNNSQEGVGAVMNRTDRLLAIVLELQAHGWQRAEDMATTFEISKRTIYRDMQALAESGVPVVSEAGRGYSLMEGYFLPPLSFSSDEAVLLLLGADFMRQNFDRPYQRVAESAAAKLEVALSDRLRTAVADLKQSLHFVAMNPVVDPALTERLQHLRRAILERQRLRLMYVSRWRAEGGESTEREVDPYALVSVDGVWYLSAYCHLRHDVRNFRLDRIDRLHVLPKRFTRPADFDIGVRESDMRSIRVRVWCSGTIARWVREEQPFFAVDYAEADGGLMVTFQVRQENDVLRWILGWGAQARVLEPDSLKAQIAVLAAATVQLYQP